MTFSSLTLLLSYAIPFFAIGAILGIKKKMDGFTFWSWMWNYIQIGICIFEMVWLFGHSGVADWFSRRPTWDQQWNFTDTLTPSFWQCMWAMYAYEDPRYGRSEPFNIYAEGINGVETLIPVLIICYYIYNNGRGKNRKPWPMWVYLMEILITWQIMYGTFIYWATWFYEDVPTSEPIRQMIYVAGFNSAYIIGPATQLYDAWKTALSYGQSKSTKVE